jgi:hypothetical protein
MVEAASTHEHQAIRGAYIRVFTEVLSRRVDFSFAVDHKLPSYEDLLNELMQMLLSRDRELARLLCSTARGKEAEDVCRSLLMILDHHHNPDALKLLDWTIEYEVANTPRIGTLFRSETMGTKLMGSFFSTKGRHYLTTVLADPIQYFLQNPVNLEIDPNKGVDVSQLEQNMTNLKEQTSIFLNSILHSAPICPRELKHILEVLRESTSRKFGSTEGCDRIAVAGYIFLRFFCPAIAMPGKFQLTGTPEQDIKPLTRQQSRGLLLIAKILQNLANGTHFTEECMEPLNSWIDSYADSISYFSYDISTENSFGSQAPKPSQEIDSDDETLSDDELKKSQEDESEDSDNSEEEEMELDRATQASKRHSSKSQPEEFDANHMTEQQISAMAVIHKFLYNNHERLERLLGSSGNLTSQMV